MNEKLKRTDAAIKSTEAWWAFWIADGGLGQTILRWFTPIVGSVLFLWLSYISNWLNAYGPISWGLTAIFGGIATLVIMFFVESVRIRQIKRKILSSEFKRIQQSDHDGINSVVTRYDSDIGTIRSRIEKFEKDIVHFLKVHKDSDDKIGDVSEKITQLENNFEQNDKKIEMKFEDTANKIAHIKRCAEESIFSEKILPTICRLIKELEIEAVRQPSPLNALDRENTTSDVYIEEFRAIFDEIKILKETLDVYFGDKIFGHIIGYINIEGLSRGSEEVKKFQTGDNLKFRDPEHKFAWLMHIDCVGGTRGRLLQVKNILEKKADFRQQICSV